MKAVILLADGFEDLQFFHIWFRLREEGWRVTLASPGSQRLTGQRGYTVEPDMPMHEINPAEYDLLYIPGGSSPEKLRLREEAVDIARTFMQEERCVAACGHGAQLLISAQALEGKKMTCSPGIRDDVRGAGADYLDQAVVVDGTLFTARGTDDLPALAGQLLLLASMQA